MNTYSFEFTKTYTGTYQVEAESEEDAREYAKEDLNSSEAVHYTDFCDVDFSLIDTEEG